MSCWSLELGCKISAPTGNAVMKRANLAGQTILVVEGEPLIALDLRTALEAAGAEVMVARNATEALARISEFDFAAAVVDWRPDSEDHRCPAARNMDPPLSREPISC